MLLPGELFGALRGRLYDSNKNIVMATLTTISNLASAMGQAVEKSSKVSEFSSAFVFSSQLLLLYFLFQKFNFLEMVYCRAFCLIY